MNKIDYLISSLSWEDRFIEGIQKNLTEHTIEEIFLINYGEMSECKFKAKKKVIQCCLDKKVKLTEVPLSLNPVKRWLEIKKTFFETNFINKKILFDLSTTRRETIWVILSFLRDRNNLINYIYYKPQNYNEKWLSSEPDTPRLLLKHSGISELGKKTALFILTGFDSDRTRQLVNYYEPELTILGIQNGDQFENSSRNNKDLHIDACKGTTKFETFELDAYSENHSYNDIEKQIEKIKDKYNVIASSNGPKLSALSLYQVYLKNPQISLSYVPCKLYNLEYSQGLGEGISGILNLQ
jgi:hypothetical protein